MTLSRLNSMVVCLLLSMASLRLSAEPRQVQPDAGKPALPAEWIEAFQWRSIGPANMGGRITAIAVYEKDPNTWWAATASGGLLKTTNNGFTLEHQFDREATVSIGDVQVAQSNPSVVWVGTGEANPRNSVSWGDGVYKSIDGGKTWKNMGLKKTFQIGRIAIHPEDPNIVYVGALGRLWGPNEERGLFKTTDGGKTWEKILYIDDKTGITDVQMHPKDPDTLLVAAYERQREPFDVGAPPGGFWIKEYDAGSGLYKTSDAGKTFKKLTMGLPTCKLGRIGICYYRRDPDYVYIIVESERTGRNPPNEPYMGVSVTDAEVGARITAVTKESPAERAGLKKGDIVVSVGGVTVDSYTGFLREVLQRAAGDKAKLEVCRDHKGVEVEIVFRKRPPMEARRFRARMGGQRENVQDEQGMEGREFGGVYRSEDGGETWTRINSVNPYPMYFSQIRVDPRDNKHIYVLGANLFRSVDGGETFTPDGARYVTPDGSRGGVHVDHHAMWIDPRDGRHMILGNDGGVYVTCDRGEYWDHLNHVAIGQFYHVTVGPRRDYRVYGGLQDNGVWGGPSQVRHGSGPLNSDWIQVLGDMDGFICHVDPTDADRIYVEAQSGRMKRINLCTGQRADIQPRPPKDKDVEYRFNWKTPFILSHHNPSVFYSAGNHVFRSEDKGDHAKAISPDIANTESGRGSAIAESPLDKDVLYVGTTEGTLWMTHNGGKEWFNLFSDPPKGKEPEAEKKPEEEPSFSSTSSRFVSKLGEAKPIKDLLPRPLWVSSIEASRAVVGRAYITFDGHRSDDDRPYVFVTENYGKTWRSIRANLPDSAGSTRVIREDVKNQNVLYLGTEFAAWVSVDRGAGWTKLDSNLPTVAVHEIAIHPTAGEIVAGTHGRSLWVLDVTALRQMSSESVKADAHLYRPNDAVRWHRQLLRGSSGTRRFVGQNPPFGAQIFYSLGKDAAKVALKITDIHGQTVCELKTANKAGLHVVRWDLRPASSDSETEHARSRPSVQPGSYLVTLTVDDKEYRQPLAVLSDPDYPESIVTREEAGRMIEGYRKRMDMVDRQL